MFSCRWILVFLNLATLLPLNFCVFQVYFSKAYVLKVFLITYKCFLAGDFWFFWTVLPLNCLAILPQLLLAGHTASHLCHMSHVSRVCHMCDVRSTICNDIWHTTLDIDINVVLNPILILLLLFLTFFPYLQIFWLNFFGVKMDSFTRWASIPSLQLVYVTL